MAGEVRKAGRGQIMALLCLVKESGFYSTSQSFQKRVLPNASVIICSKNNERIKKLMVKEVRKILHTIYTLLGRFLRHISKRRISTMKKPTEHSQTQDFSNFFDHGLLCAKHLLISLFCALGSREMAQSRKSCRCTCVLGRQLWRPHVGQTGGGKHDWRLEVSRLVQLLSSEVMRIWGKRGWTGGGPNCRGKEGDSSHPTLRLHVREGKEG